MRRSSAPTSNNFLCCSGCRGGHVLLTTIGHMKFDGKLAINWLAGAIGDAMHEVLRVVEHRRLILNKLKSCVLAHFSC